MTLTTVNISDHLDPTKFFPRSALPWYFIPQSLLDHPVEEATEQAVQGVFERLVKSKIYLREEERWDMEGLRMLIRNGSQNSAPSQEKLVAELFNQASVLALWQSRR